MPILVVMGVVGLLILHAVLSKPTKADLDAKIPSRLGQAVLKAYTSETNPSMRAAFSGALARGGYPKAAAVLGKSKRLLG